MLRYVGNAKVMRNLRKAHFRSFQVRYMDLLDPLPTLTPILTRALLAALCGGVVGLERELREKPAGLKTNALICLGAAIYVYFGELLTERGGGDVTRIPGQVIVGMGFIGAGAIVRERGSILGLTTAATLWVVAAIGLFAGMGYFLMAISLTAVTLGILTSMRTAEALIVGQCDMRSAQVVFRDEEGKTRTHLAQILDAYNSALDRYSLAPQGNKMVLTFQYCDRHDSHRRLLKELWKVEEVIEVHYPLPASVS